MAGKLLRFLKASPCVDFFIAVWAVHKGRLCLLLNAATGCADFLIIRFHFKAAILYAARNPDRLEAKMFWNAILKKSRGRREHGAVGY